MKIGLTYDLRDDYLAEGYTESETAEFDSELTIYALADAIQACGHTIERIGHARALCERLASGDRWDLVFNIAEGLDGRSREAQVPCLLELYRIPYALSDPLTCAVTLDKAITKKLVRASGFNTPDFYVLNKLDELPDVQLTYPLFTKPLAEGTGKGVRANSFVSSPDELREACAALLDEFHEPVLIEAYLPGREFTVGLIGNGAQAHVLGTMEVILQHPHTNAIYSYEAKEHWHKLVGYGAPEVGSLRDAIETLALGCYRALECRDAARIDIRLDAGGVPSFMEVNPLPGLNPVHSDLPMIAYRAGVTYRELIRDIVESACQRLGIA